MRTGALAPYVGNVRAYMCPSRYRQFAGLSQGSKWSSSYMIVPSMNCSSAWARSYWDRLIRATHDIGKTVLFVKKTSELLNPGPASRMVFLDQGHGHAGTRAPEEEEWVDLAGLWWWVKYTDLFVEAVHHSEGTCMSFADGHVEYWRWTDPDTIAHGRWAAHYLVFGTPGPGPWVELRPDNPDVVRLHTAIWGKGPQ